MNKSSNFHFVQRLRALLTKGFKNLKGAVKLLGKAFTLPLGTIFFIPNPWIGAILWIALLQNPPYAVFAVLGLAVGTAVDKILKSGDEVRLGGGLRANALLASIMVGWLTATTDILLWIQLLIAAGSASAAAILAAAIIHTLKETSIPSLVWGYCLVAAMMFTICSDCAVLASNNTLALPIPNNLPEFGAAFIGSLGALIYSPTVESGLIVGLAILLWSRILFFTGLIGWLAGVSLALSLENIGVTYNWLPMSYNYFIAGMALGSVYFLPGRTSLLLAILGGLGASFSGLLLQHILPDSPIAYLPIAAAATIGVIIGAVTLAGNQCIAKLNTTRHLRPEEAWWHMKYWSQRFGYKDVLFSTPIGGELRISQGFNGLLSHAGNWRHALDFQRPITVDYSLDPALNIWGAPIYAPASGMIERLNSSVPDNQLGVSNFAENWGNHIVIRLDQGGWALLAHLQQDSIAVSTGARVEAGDYLGKVGNSGRSPIPHLHMQAQNGVQLGTLTIPFRLLNYLSTTDEDSPFKHWNAANLPAEGEIIMAAYPNTLVHNLLASLSTGSSVWSSETIGRIPSSFKQASSKNIIRINTTLNTEGQHLYKSELEKEAIVVSLAPDAWRIVETTNLTTPFMRLLALAVPSIPYAATTGMKWNDPVPIMPSGFTSWLSMATAPYFGSQFTIANCKCTSEPSIETNGLQIETIINNRLSSPIKLTCHFEMLKGPVKIRADFKHGSIVYSLLSFEPKLPFDNTESE